MKIKISNFGPIKKAELDLSKDLIMVYGENSVGKSYAIQVAYLVLKVLLGFKDDFSIVFSQLYNNFMGELKHLPLEDFNNKILKHNYYNDFEDLKELISKIEKSKKFDITSDINEAMTGFLNKATLKKLTLSFQSLFSNLNNITNSTNLPPTIELSMPDFTINILYQNKLSFTFTSKKKTFIRNSENNSIRTENNIIYYDLKVNEPEFISLLGTLIYRIPTDISNQIAGILPKLYFLPASRSGLYTGMSAFSQIIAELSRKRALLSSKIELPGIPEPVSDYFLELSNISSSQRKYTTYSLIAAEIESKILKGTIGFDEHKKELNYRPKELYNPLELTASSSMVSELSSVVAFLKYVLEEQKEGHGKPVIFMEEPEAHLHPRAQVALSEIFVKLVKAGVKLVITSHSNYIFNKFNNLVIAGELKPEQYAPIILKMGEGGSLAHLMELDELGVEDENFTEVSEELYEEREKLLERLNEAEG